MVITYTSPSSTPSVDDLISRISSLQNGSEAISVRADLRKPSSVTQIIMSTVSAFGTEIDVLINNAGVLPVLPLSNVTNDDISAVYDINVRAPILLTQAVLPHLRRPGRIINIGSVGGRSGFKHLSLYCSTKAALEGLTRSWAAELGSQGTTVNCVDPGPVKSAMQDDVPNEIVEMQMSTTPVQQRLGNADDIGPVVAWLAGESSRWISGQCISASGGWAMY